MAYKSFRTIILVLAAFLLLLPAISGAFKVEDGNNPPAAGHQQNVSKATTTVGSNDREIKNVLLDKIENNVLYAKDGSSYKIGNSTRIIDNSKSSRTKMRTAELIFIGGELSLVTIK